MTNPRVSEADVDESKRCSRCGEGLPLGDFGKNAAKADGLQQECRACRSQTQREYRFRKPEKMRELGRNQMRRRRSADPEAERRYMQAWRAANPELVKAGKEAWERANRARVRVYANAANRRYKRANPDKVRDLYHRRRALKRAGTFGAVDLQALWEFQDGHCGICGSEMDRATPWPDPASPSIDHIVPLSKGGTHEQANLQWACLECNLRKGDRLL